MKKIILFLTSITTIAVTSCNSNHSTTDASMDMNHDSMPMQEHTTPDNNMKILATTFSDVDPGVSTFIKSLVTDYLEVKNALADDKETAAAAASGKMYDAMKGFDRSLLSADQKKVYDNITPGLEEHTANMSKNNIEQQRENFAMMSKGMYEMAKAFGAGMTLYHDHCPMYKNGSMWLSETRDIKNPYFGEKMMTCGNVEEMMK